MCTRWLRRSASRRKQSGARGAGACQVSEEAVWNEIELSLRYERHNANVTRCYETTRMYSGPAVRLRARMSRGRLAWLPSHQFGPGLPKPAAPVLQEPHATG